MIAPDLIADQAILTVSAWQRETSQQMADRLLPIWQARRDLPPHLRLNDNTSLNDWQHQNALVERVMGREEILRKVNAPGRVEVAHHG